MRWRRLREDGYPSLGQDVNKQIGWLSSCIKQAMKMRISWDGVRSKWEEVTERVSPDFKCFLGQVFCGFQIWELQVLDFGAY